MGGWMTYQRARSRGLILFRKPDTDWDPYWRAGDPRIESLQGLDFALERDRSLLIGDFNRMERDYLNPKYPEPPFASRPEGSSPAEVCATATGVDIETVRKILNYIFLEQQ